MEIEHEIIGTFFDQMSSAAYIKDENLKFIYVNPVYAEFYGMEPERFIGRRSFQITSTVATKLMEQDEAKVLATGVASKIDDRATSHRGKTLWREVERRPILTQSGDRYLTVTMRDISKRKEVEFKLQDKEKELSETRELAETAEHRSADFFAKISHQVRTPVQTIIAIANSVSDENFDKDRKSFSDLIVSSGNAALTVLDDISSHSLLDIMKVPVKSETFDLFNLVSDVTSVVMPDAYKKNLKFSTYIDPDIPMHLMGDCGKIRQVLINLIGNAVKFSDEGDIKVNIQIVPDDKQQSVLIRFDVNDTGHGIAAQNQQGLFDKYRPVSGNGQRGGLGLSISSSLVSLMGGDIGLDSRLGIGSKFWFEIGFDVPKKTAKTILKNPDLKNKRFIVIDSNTNDRILLEARLKEWGGDVAACQSADEAIAVMCATFENDLSIEGIFVDEHTNSANEFDLVTLMKEDDTLQHIPLFMMVSMSDARSVHASLANNHIVKPLDTASLRTVISNAFSENIDEKLDVDQKIDLHQRAGSQEENIAPEGLQKLISKNSDISKIDILILESNTVNQIMLAQILDTTGYSFKITSKLSEGEELFKSCHPKIVMVDATSREFNNEDTRLSLERLKRFNSLVPLLGMVAPQSADEDDETCVLIPVFDGQISKPISPPELFNKIERWMRIADSSHIRIA